MLSENLIKVNKKWRDEKLNLGKIYLEEEIVDAFAKLGITLAKDAVQVYSTLGGFDENGMDSENLTFWTLEKILRETDFNAEKVYFADFLIDSHHYYFERETPESSVVCVSYSETDQFRIADSFDEFFELYLHDIKRLFP